MEILQLVDQLEEMLNRSRRMPFGNAVLVDEESCLRIIDQMRISIPSAIKESERMLAERDRILAQAEAQAEEILAEAERQARALVQRDRITQMAYEEAERIRQTALAEADEIRRQADTYALEVLQNLARRLSGALREVQSGIETLETSLQASTASVVEPSGTEATTAEADEDEQT